MHLRNRWIVILAGIAWLGVLALGTVVLAAYENAPGAIGEAAPTWPADLPLATAAGQPTLVVLAHPRCPCTQASLSELERLLARHGEDVRTHVLFFTPEDASPTWAHTDLWDQAAALPGVEVSTDPGGALALRFGALTSGHAVLYGADGRLRFVGGLTGARGHEGDNAGRQALSRLIHGHASPIDRTFVFGCALFNHTS